MRYLHKLLAEMDVGPQPFGWHIVESIETLIKQPRITDLPLKLEYLVCAAMQIKIPGEPILNSSHEKIWIKKSHI